MAVFYWNDMSSAPTDGSLVDLLFGDVRYIDCYFDLAHNCWAKKHGYPSVTRVFFGKPTGWLPRPDGLVLPYADSATGRQYIP